MSDNYFKSLECDKKILKILKWDISSVRIGNHQKDTLHFRRRKCQKIENFTRSQIVVDINLSVISKDYFLSPKGEFKHMPKEQRKAAKKAKKLAKKGYKW